MNFAALKHLSILYIEDEPHIRKNALEYLGRYCKKVYEAEDGIVGLSLYNRYKPDLIITDIKMPKLNGLDFIAKVREEDATTPIIITTAHNDTDYLLKAVELRLVRYLIKPITSEKLHQALNMACESLADESVGLINLDAHTQYDMPNQTLFVNQKPIRLTHNEVVFFDYLAKNSQRVISYSEIENLIWAYEGMSMDALRSLVRGLRKKLGGDFIENVSGIGYKLIPLSRHAYHSKD